MSIQAYLNTIIGHLGTAARQRVWLDDKIIADHIDEALAAAEAAKREFVLQRERQADYAALLAALKAVDSECLSSHITPAIRAAIAKADGDA